MPSVPPDPPATDRRGRPSADTGSTARSARTPAQALRCKASAIAWQRCACLAAAGKVERSELTRIKAARELETEDCSRMPAFLYRCPFTGLRVQAIECVCLPDEGERYTAQS